MAINRRKNNKRGIHPLMNWRINFLFLLVILIIGIIVHRLYELQILEHEKLEAKAREQHQFFEKLKPQRGHIYIKDGDTNSIPIATNEQRNTVYIVPKNIVDKQGVIKTLASLFLIDEQEIERKVMKEDDLYEVIKRKITQEESEIIKEKDMQGVEMFSETWRNYPQGTLASKILGFVGYSDGKRVGQYGIEGYFNEELEGKSGFVKAERDTSGRWISINQRVMEKPRHGVGIVLTLDQSVQYFVENLLRESVEKYGATSGSIIVMDPNTGKVIAMADNPSYNNNEFNKVQDPAIFKNNCISSHYEPGSVFKPVTASIPLDMDLVNPDSTYVDKGYYKVSGFTIKNSDEKSYGKTSYTRFLELSLNTGAIWAMQLAGQENFHKYLKNYGFGQKTGIELFGETKGDISNLDFNREVNYVTASYGQGISMTPIQLVSAFSAIINGGNLMKPQIVDKFIYADQEEEKTIEPKIIRKVIEPDTSQKMRAMLISVVKNGWGKKAQVPGYLIGGKTGTAQVPKDKQEGYGDKTIHSFAGFAMTDKVEFVTLVKLDNVSAVRFASDSSALITGKLNRFLLDHYNIFPTEEIDEKELKKFNQLMELKKEDIKRIDQQNQEGVEGISPLED